MMGNSPKLQLAIESGAPRTVQKRESFALTIYARHLIPSRSIDVRTIRIIVFASLFGLGVICAVAACAFLLYRRLTSTNGASQWTPATTRIKISGSPLDSESHIKLLHQQPRLGGSGMSLTEMSPLMRHKPLRDSRQPSEAQQHRMGAACISSCNALATTAMTQQLPMTSSYSAGSRKTLVRPLSQSALYLARPPTSSQMAHHQQTSLTNLVGSGCISSGGNPNDMLDNQGQSEPAKIDDWQRTPPQLEITLVYVSASAQLLVHIHRLSNATPAVRCPAKESTGTQVKVVLDGRIKRAFRSALVATSASTSSENSSSIRQPKSQQQPQQRCAQVFKFPDVTAEELLNGRLTTTVYLGRGRWKSDKKIGSFNVRLGELALADGVPRTLTGLLIPQKQRADESAGHHPAEKKKKNDAQAEPCRPMTGAPELGQLLISLRHEQVEESAAGRPSSSRLLKVLIHRAYGLPPTKTVFEPDYIVVVNSSYPDGGSEIKETSPAKGKAPEWNQTIEFDVTNRPIGSCWLHLVLIRKTKKGHSPDATIGHLTLGANSTPDGERHWQALVNATHDVEITRWHRLTSR